MTHSTFDKPQSKRRYQGPDGTVKSYLPGQEPPGWVKFTKRTKTDAQLQDHFKARGKAVGASNQGKRKFRGPDGSTGRYLPGQEPTGWIQVRPERIKPMYVRIGGYDGTTLYHPLDDGCPPRYFIPGQEPEGWVEVIKRVMPHAQRTAISATRTGQRTYQGPDGSTAQRHPGQEPEGWVPFDTSRKASRARRRKARNERIATFVAEREAQRILRLEARIKQDEEEALLQGTQPIW
jgi:hypothetical protein